MYVLQCTVFKTYWSAGNVGPNLLLMFTCIVGFMRGRTSGSMVGFFSGMLVDIMSGGMIGFTALLYIYAGFFNGMFHREYAKDQMLLPISLVAMCDFSYGLIYYIITYVMRNRLNMGYYISTVILPEMVYTVCVAVIAYVVVYFINRKLDLIDRRRNSRHVKRTNN